MYFGLMAYWSNAPVIIAVVIGAGLIIAYLPVPNPSDKPLH